MSHIEDDEVEGLEELDDEAEAEDAEPDEQGDGESEGEGQGTEDDGAEANAEPEAEEDPVEPPARQARQKSRAQRTIRELRERTQRAERTAQDAIAEAQRAQQASVQRQQADFNRQEQEFLAAATFEERQDYLFKKAQSETQQRLNQMQFQLADSGDRTAFAAECMSPALAKIQNRVEQELSQLRANGHNFPRMVVAQNIIGRMALERSSQNLGKQKAKAGNAVDRERARPGGGRGDGGSASRQRAARDPVADFEKRFGNHEILTGGQAWSLVP